MNIEISNSPGRLESCVLGSGFVCTSVNIHCDINNDPPYS